MPTSHVVSSSPAVFAVRRIRPTGSVASTVHSRSAAQPYELASPCTLPAVIPGNADGLLLRTHADKDLEVHIPYSASFGDYDEIELVLDGDPLGVAPIGSADRPPVIVRYLPGPLAEGRHTVSYKVLTDGDWNSYEGYPAQPLRIDRTAPGGAAIAGLEFSQQVIDFGVTPADLVEGRLSVIAPAWTGMEVGDWVEPYYLLDPLTGISFTIRSADQQVASGAAGRALTLGIPQADLLAMGDGVRWFGYVLRDLAGNAAALRPTPVPLTIRLDDTPAGLRPPQIARHDDDGVISEADAREPVEVIIPGFDNARPGDEIVFVLGSTRSAPLRINEDDVTNDPIMAFSIAYAMVASGGGPGAPQRYSAEAYYEVYRGAQLQAASPLPNLVAVDITTPAGPDPDPSTAINEALRRATVRGASDVDNVISAADSLQDATVFIPFYADNLAPPPADRAYLAVDDVIRVSWGAAQLNATLTINADHLNLGAPLAITVTSAEIISHGPGDIAVSYSVSRAIEGTLPPVFNAVFAAEQAVVVSSAGLLPGGPDGLPSGDFTEKTGRGALSRAIVESDGGTPYRVMLNYLNVARDDRITIRLQGHDDDLGVGPQTPNTAYSDYYLLSDEDLPTAQDPDKFHDFLIPTAYFAGKWTTPVQGRGSVVGRHSIENAAGSVEAPSVAVIVAVTDLVLSV